MSSQSGRISLFLKYGCTVNNLTIQGQSSVYNEVLSLSRGICWCILDFSAAFPFSGKEKEKNYPVKDRVSRVNILWNDIRHKPIETTMPTKSKICNLSIPLKSTVVSVVHMNNSP